MNFVCLFTPIVVVACEAFEWVVANLNFYLIIFSEINFYRLKIKILQILLKPPLTSLFTSILPHIPPNFSIHELLKPIKV